MKHIIALAIGLTLVGAAQADERYYRMERGQGWERPIAWSYEHGGRPIYASNHRPVIVEQVRGPSAGEVLVPLIIGGMVGAAIANANQQPQTVVVQPQPQVIVQQPQPQGFVQCPAGTMPFEQRGWVKNAYGQYVQATYIECK
jgi:hypothetical protein